MGQLCRRRRADDAHVRLKDSGWTVHTYAFGSPGLDTRLGTTNMVDLPDAPGSTISMKTTLGL